MLLILTRPMEEPWNFGDVVVVAEYIYVYEVDELLLVWLEYDLLVLEGIN